MKRGVVNTKLNDFKKVCSPWIYAARFFMTVALILNIVLISLPSERDVESSLVSEEVDGSAITVLIFQDGAAIFNVVVSFVAFVFIWSAFPETVTSRWVTLVAIELLSLTMDLANLAYPTPLRLGITYATMLFRIASLICMGVLINKFDKQYPSNDLPTHSSITTTLDTDEKEDLLRRVEDLLEVHNTRRVFHKKLRSGSQKFSWFCIIILLLSMGNFVFEFRKTISTHGEFFSEDELKSLNSWSKTEEHFGVNRTAAGKSHKALIIVFDGFNSVGAEQPDFKAFVNSDLFSKDSKRYNMSVQLPTMSVPNWLVTITGVRPEITGVWGNLGIPETNFDSLYRLTQHYELNRGITSSPWFSALISSRLPLLNGDGTVAFSYAITDPTPTANDADNKRSEVMKLAIKNKYDLFLCHWSDADLQGHANGIVAEYNPANSYREAVKNRTVTIKEVVDMLDNDTMLVLTSDHGMLDRGGHGGNSTNVVTVPTWIYVKNSGLGSITYNGPRFRERIQNVDLAPTVAAFMGMPVPRQNQGLIINDVMGLMNTTDVVHHLRDLFIQKQRFVRAYLTKSLVEVAGENKTLLTDAVNSTDAKVYRDKIVALLNLFDDSRASLIEAELTRNILATIGINLVLSFGMLFVLQKYTFCDLTSVLGKFDFVRKIQMDGKEEEEDDIEYHNSTVKRNRTCLMYSLLAVTLHLGFTLLAFVLLFSLYGYDIWDSTYLHFPTSVVIYFVYVLGPSTLFGLLGIRLYSIPFMKRVKPELSLLEKVQIYARAIFSYNNAKFGRLDYVYLYKYYHLLISTSNLLLLFVFQAVYTFILPDIFRINHVLDTTWGFRFRVITVQLMMIPPVLLNLLALNSWQTEGQLDPVMNSVYKLLVDKLQRTAIISTKEAATIKKHLKGEKRMEVENSLLLFSADIDADKLSRSSSWVDMAAEVEELE